MNDVTRLLENLKLEDLPPVPVTTSPTKTIMSLCKQNEHLRRQNEYLKWLLANIAERHSKIPRWVS